MQSAFSMGNLPEFTAVIEIETGTSNATAIIGTTKNVIREGAAGVHVPVVLSAEPTSDIRIDVSVGAPIVLNVNVMTFTAANWNKTQDLVVSRAEDDYYDGNSTFEVGTKAV